MPQLTNLQMTWSACQLDDQRVPVYCGLSSLLNGPALTYTESTAPERRRPAAGFSRRSGGKRRDGASSYMGWMTISADARDGLPGEPAELPDSLSRI